MRPGVEERMRRDSLWNVRQGLPYSKGLKNIWSLGLIFLSFPANSMSSLRAERMSDSPRAQEVLISVC